MAETKYYKVAEHIFCVTAESSDFELMKNYEPFRCDEVANDKMTFAMSISESTPVSYMEEMRQEDEGQEIICGKTADGKSVFEFVWLHQSAGKLVCDADYRKGDLIVTGQSRKMAIDNTLMVLYALATAPHGTALFHSAVVSHEGRAYMFLGKSGTGKSTHARLWLNHIEGTDLVNDDNPVVRMDEQGNFTVYGSPWSGKTPCYRNISYPVGAIVLLSQAPHNKIRRLKGIQAYAALVPSISGKRWDKKIADGLHHTENSLAKSVAVWHLECLPNEEAAKVCQSNVEQ